jgi:hypothetical protein
MLIGQSVVAAQSDGATYYGPWMPRQGDALSVVLEVIDAMTPFTLTCEVQTKNNEDSDASATLLTGDAELTATGTDTLSTTGAEELVRFKFTAIGDTVGRADTWVHFRTNPIIWQPN